MQSAETKDQSNVIRNKVMQALMLHASHIDLLNKNEDYWGSENQIALDNASFNLTCELVGFDTNEDDEWGRYTIKATNVEIAQYAISQLIKRFESVISLSEKLFIVVGDSGYTSDEWKKVLTTDLDEQAELYLWDEDTISTDCGWDDNEAEELAAIELYESQQSYGLYRHSIYRIF